MGQRPPHVRPPAYLSKTTPVPEPGPSSSPDADAPAATDLAEGRLEPTRYGDWERKGLAVDF